MIVEFSPELMKVLSVLGTLEVTEKELPKYTVDGQDIATVKQLSNAMGIDEDVAALYGLVHGNGELKEESYTLLTDKFRFRNLTVSDYIEKIIQTESKRVRLVRTVLGARRFSQPRGSIIVTDGEAPLNNLRALPNDVRGYDKLTDSKGRIFYVGEEANRWVVRAPGQHDPIFVGDADKDVYRWLNNAVVDKPTKPAKGRKKK